ncbi:MAG TPA: glycoside hydrolase [Phycisphaerae bacterium]|nr:glycoside hydrolase [Phycisphaerae bacterium]
MVTQNPDGGVEFTFYRPDATRVAIAGDFNSWQPSFQMRRLDDGRWHSRLKLAPGSYQFRYCADGEWFNDYAAFGLEPGPFGLNSVARVDPPFSGGRLHS